MAAFLGNSHRDVIEPHGSSVGRLRDVLGVVTRSSLGNLAVSALVGDHAVAALVATLVAAFNAGGASARCDVLNDLAAAARGLAEGGLASETALVAPLVDLRGQIYKVSIL